MIKHYIQSFAEKISLKFSNSNLGLILETISKFVNQVLAIEETQNVNPELTDLETDFVRTISALDTNIKEIRNQLQETVKQKETLQKELDELKEEIVHNYFRDQSHVTGKRILKDLFNLPELETDPEVADLMFSIYTG